MKLLLVYITARDKKQARMIGKALVTQRLAACANIIDNMNSLYVWENKLCDDREAILVCKTRASLFPSLIRRVKKLHSYKVPCIVALPVVGGNQDYLKWVEKNTRQR